MKRNTAGQFLSVALINATTGAALAGAAVTVRRNLDGVDAAVTGSVSEPNSDGKYLFALSQADSNGDDCSYYFTAANAIPVCVNVHTDFPQTGDAYARLGAPAGASVSADVAAVTADVAATHVHAAGSETQATEANAHAHTIDGHITADYGATEKAAIDLLDDVSGGLADIHVDVAAVKGDTAAILVDTGTAGVIVASVVAGAIDAAAINDGAIDAGAIANGAITASTFAAGAINAAAIAADAIDASALAADAVAEIDTRLSSTHGAGTWGSGGGGSVAVTLTIDDGTNPLDGVEVKITTDAGGSTVAASGTTDSLGQFSTRLDPGTYYVFCQRSGTNFTNPTTLTVTA